QDEDHGHRYSAPAGRSAAPAHRLDPLARLGSHRLDDDPIRRRARGPCPAGAHDRRPPRPRLLHPPPPRPQRTARLRLRTSDPRVPLDPVPRPLHALRRRPRAPPGNRRPLGDPRPRRRDRPDLRHRRPAAGPPGLSRTVFLESHGCDKDADRNTWEAQQLEHLPFRAMTGYPYGPGESYPDTPRHREYRKRWLT